jgi:RHS repeat-associated protein
MGVAMNTPIFSFSRQALRTAAVAFVLSCLSGTALAGETLTFFHNDVAGSPAVATDANGLTAWKETYRPYGDQLIDSSASTNNKLWFAGKSFDDSTGLSYMGARYYDPTLGRFMAVDPVSFNLDNLHSYNRYTYANNNPYKFVDPDGREAATAQWLQQTNAFTDRMTANLTQREAAILLVGQLGMLAIPLGFEASLAIVTRPEAALALTESVLAQEALGGGTLIAGSAAVASIEASAALVDDAARSAANAVRLEKQFASESQMGEIGTIMAGADARAPFRDAARVAEQYGGEAADWVKKTSSTFASRDGTKFETHWVENLRTGQRIEHKTKFVD